MILCGHMILARSYRTVLLLLVLAGSSLPGPSKAQETSPAPPDTVVVTDIMIRGNRVTRERIILRELLVDIGDTIPAGSMYDLLERSRQNLVNTALFHTVNVMPLYLDPRHVIIEVTVSERWYLWPSVSLELADPNFNTWWQTKDLSRINYGLYLYKYNFRGQNETIYVMSQFGYTQQYALRYRIPYIDKGQRWGATIGGAYLQQEEVTAGTKNNERLLVSRPFTINRREQLADLELSLRPSHDVRHYWRFGFNQATITDTITQVAEDYFDGDKTRTRFLSLGYSIVWDTRDLRIFPKRGHFAELRVDRYGLALLDIASPDVTTFYLGLKRWFQLSQHLTLAASFRGKATWGTPPYYVQRGLGYSDIVRGYEYYVVDGEHYILGRANLIIPIFKPRVTRVEPIPIEAFRTVYFALYLNVYTDLGRVWDDRYAEMNFLANRWMNGHGVGLDLVTSYDQVVRGEYSLNGLGEHGFFLHFTQPF